MNVWYVPKFRFGNTEGLQTRDTRRPKVFDRTRERSSTQGRIAMTRVRLQR